MLVEVSYLIKGTHSIAYKRKEIYDVASRAEAHRVLTERYGAERVLKAEFKELEASETKAGSELQGAMFANGLEA